MFCRSGRASYEVARAEVAWRRQSVPVPRLGRLLCPRAQLYDYGDLDAVLASSLACRESLCVASKATRAQTLPSGLGREVYVWDCDPSYFCGLRCCRG